MSALQFPTLDAAIASFEGFGTPGTLATVNNNPGNLIYNGYTQNLGATGSNQGFAVFPDSVTGANAEDNLVGYYAGQGDTIQQLINSWAPPTAPGNSAASTTNYVNSVSQAVGGNPSTPVSSLVGQGATTGNTNGGYTSAFPALSNFLDMLGVPGGPTATGATGTTANGIVGFSWSRVAAFVLGLIFIAAGLYLFKPVQQVINNGVKGASIAAL